MTNIDRLITLYLALDSSDSPSQRTAVWAAITLTETVMMIRGEL